MILNICCLRGMIPMHHTVMKSTIALLTSAILLTSTPVDFFASKDTTPEYMESVTACFTAGAHCAINESVVLETAKAAAEIAVEENELPETEVAAITGEDIVEFALQFVGNRYVYGGTSLTNGTDCSGFVMRVYEAFGYELPRSSYYQRSTGVKVSAEDIQPGDIVCYSGHVGIYIGTGQIVHAANSRLGITTTNWTYKSIICVRRVL